LRKQGGEGYAGDVCGASIVVALDNSGDPTMIPEIIELTRSSNGNERRLAASALEKLAQFKPEIYEAVEALERLLEDEKPRVRQYALKALSKIGVVNKEKIKLVIADPFEKAYNISIAKKLLRVN
jgi:HEAT repeat protein